MQLSRRLNASFRQWPEEYDSCHTFLHVARVRKHTDMREWTCENACNSRMSVCFLTRSTCKNVRQNLIPGHCLASFTLPAHCSYTAAALQQRCSHAAARSPRAALASLHATLTLPLRRLNTSFTRPTHRSRAAATLPQRHPNAAARSQHTALSPHAIVTPLHAAAH